jgi:hypothetical protein
MPNPFQNVNGPAARKMAAELSSASTLKWVGVAFLVHVVILCATSVGYIRDTWVDPQGAQARRAAAAKAAEIAAAAKPADVAQPAAKSDATKPAVAAPKPDDTAALIEKNKDKPVIKNITETAKPGETPKSPTRNGFNFDDDALK